MTTPLREGEVNANGIVHHEPKFGEEIRFLVVSMRTEDRHRPLAKQRQEQREVRWCGLAAVECSRCGKEVVLMADTDGWTEIRRGFLKHDSFGPATGECCGLLYADHPFIEGDGCEVYELEPAPASASSGKESGS